MSVFTTTKDKIQSKVHSSEYIRAEDKPDQVDTKPAEPATPAKPEAK